MTQPHTTSPDPAPAGTAGAAADATAGRTRPTLVLDAPSLIYRAFFALPTSLRDPAGTPVNAVRGYLDMVTRLLDDHRPAGIVHVLDADWRPAWRVAAYPGYKATRADDPPDLPGQFPVIREVLDAAGMPVADAAGFEADDVIGTMAAHATDAAPIDVVTGDRDLFQVIRDPAVRVLFPVKGVGQLERYDEAAILARYGVPAARYADFATLRGDPSDGLPGIRGVGEKTAVRLVADHADLDALVAAAGVPGRLTPRQAAAVRDAVDSGYLDAMRVVVPVARDVAYRSTRPVPPDDGRLTALAERHGLDSPIRRLRRALADADPSV